MNTQTVKNSLKLIAAATTICGMGWGILTFGHDVRGTVAVPEAEADILAFDFAPKSKTAVFVDSLDDLGMEEPRAYDWNGNKMFFSTMTTPDSPRDVLSRFQDKFLADGLNTKSHRERKPFTGKLTDIHRIKNASPAEQKKFLKVFESQWSGNNDFFSGGIVPTMVTDDYIAMTGAVSRDSADTNLDFLKEVTTKGKSKDLLDHVAGMKNIEIFKLGSGSRVTAVWSDEEMDMNKFTDVRRPGQVSGASNVPACPGCDRLMKVSGESLEEKGYVTTLFEGHSTKEDQIRFYRQAMGNRGWKESKAAEVLRKAEADGIKPSSSTDVMLFEREGKFMSFLVSPSEGGKTQVQVMESP